MVKARPLVLRSTLPLLLSALTVGLTPGCGDDDSDAQSSSSSSSTSTSTSASSGGGGAGGQEASFHLSGTLSYEYVPYDVALDGLGYDKIEVRPIRGVSVRLLDAETSVEVAKTLSDDKGAYSFEYMGTAKVKLWVYAETEVPSILIEDNTSGDELYVVESDTLNSATDAKLDVLAATGWDGKAYAKTRASAPFAVLDTAYTAARRFLDETSPPPQFLPLKVNWSVNNRPEDGDVALGQIETSHWDPEAQELFILGKEDVDTDEFDSHIIVHEWGHAFQSRISRSDSIGGTHSAGEVIDPRVAWGEGFANALSAIILDPDTVYTDTDGPKQGMGFTNDIEVNNTGADANPGWFSERTVQGIVFDLYDGPNEPFDNASLGLNAIYGALLTQREQSSLTTLFSFVAAIKESDPQAVADIDELTAYFNVNADFGVDAIQDEWGTGETHAGGVASSLPLYTNVTIGNMYTAGLFGDDNSNRLAQNVYFRIFGDGQPVMVKSACAEDIDLAVFQKGKLVTEATAVGGYEELTFPTIAGEVYVLTVQGLHKVAMSYSADISITY